MSERVGEQVADAKTVSHGADGHHAVRDYMTSVPLTVLPEDLVAAAFRLMREHSVRHVPVMRGEAPVGMLSERDIFLARSSLDDSARVAQVMTTPPLLVSSGTSVGEVAAAMRGGRYGAAIVVDSGHVVGIFTTMDALTALAEMSGVDTRHAAPATG